jgi:putative lipoprotein
MPTPGGPCALKAAIVALATAMLVAPGARAADPDPWFGRDKALHFGASALLASGGYGATALVTDDRRARLVVGGSFALSLGVAKELWDLSGHGDASWRDLTWDAVGTVTGLAVAAAVDWTIERLAARRSGGAPVPTADGASGGGL